MSTASQYTSALKALLPTGPAWPRDSGAVMSLVLAALAEEFARVDQRALVLLEEADPRTANELLGDWEVMAGLPDACSPPAPDLATRRRLVFQRIATLGGQSRQFFVDLAARLGTSIDIAEFSPFYVGETIEQPVFGEDWAYVWRVDIHYDDDDAESAIDVECLIRRARPAHTIVFFTLIPGGATAPSLWYEF